MKFTIVTILLFVFISLVYGYLRKNTVQSSEVFMNSYITNSLKGLAIFFVVFSHFGGAYQISIPRPLGTIGVSLFLILSAYGINESYIKHGLNHYFSKRVTRVLIPYWVVLILFSVFLLISHKFNLVDLLQQVFLIKLINPNYWYLIELIYWYVAYYCIIRYFKRSKVKNILFILLGVLFSIVFSYDLSYVIQILSFPIGYWISEYKTFLMKVVKSNYSTVLALIIFIIGSISAVLKGIPSLGISDTSFTGYLCGIFTGAFISISIIILVSHFDIPAYMTSFFYLISSIAYEIYLVHFFFIDMIRSDHSFLVAIEYIMIILLLSISLKYISKFLQKLLFNRSIKKI